MNLLKDPWIPVRANGGTGAFHLLTYQQLLCEPGNWQVNLPRDDLELACVQLLVCMTQVMFLPEDNPTWQKRLKSPLSPDEFAAGIKPCHDWFDLDHSTQPFMQSRGVKAAENTPIQKLLIGLPEGNNHAFFNEAGEVRNLSGTLAAITLFNQASNCPSFGGGFKGSLRGGAPITTLVYGNNLREMVWRNVLTRPHIAKRQIAIPGFEYDQPTWIKPILEGSTIPWNEIGLMRGLFWQPAQIELVKSKMVVPCDVLGGEAAPVYTGFRCEKFSFTVKGVWPHPHGAMAISIKKGDPEKGESEKKREEKFASFTTTAPAWTQLSEFLVPRSINDENVKEGSVPAGPITQANELGDSELHLLIGGYRTKQASVLERRHEMISLAQGWHDQGRLSKLVEIGNEAKKALRGKLYSAAQGSKEKRLKGIGVAIHEIAEKMFYARTESLIHETFSNDLTFREWATAYSIFAKRLAEHCCAIFEELTNPYLMRPELIPVIAWARRSLNNDLKKLMEEA
ncbi:type I-E CRISPR-associated protein Cse1/CasA [Nitrosomonas sp. Nm33]|uniref:type I-E CRISPR-associated protein Cse1/CasA n=1 Tax=Nitrosomonas sp. Nm33 TaxID=133724 RepID=UPI000896C2F1|nr:type I-E CRISPR-associated protein Cse1/CasA [Nitrosomonas sp. Nm33]SDX92354.1 CRISPR system Cascade subunit CasA [Nitrosomonas sp. Nm33]